MSDIFKATSPILKVDTEQRLVTGIVLVPDEVDLQGHTIAPDVIEATAHNFLKRYNSQTELGIQHEVFDPDVVELVESHVTKEDMFLGGEPVKKGSWVITVHVVSDEVWADVKSGALTGFSIGGDAIHTPVT